MKIELRWALPLLAAGLLAGAGCGGSAYYEPDDVEPEREDPVELASEQAERVEELDAVLARPEVDCAAACPLGDAICDLGERICGIADRHPEDEPTRDRCTDASARCDSARERIAASCQCDE